MKIKNIITVFRRELGGYFNSAIAYIYLIGFIAINNGLFMTQFFLAGRVDMGPFFGLLPFILLIFIPVITMRLWAEDKKENTFELLMTFPMRPAELVLGKFLASLLFYFISLVSTFGIPLVMLLSGRPDIGMIISGYIGALLIGAFFMSIGIFISGLTKEQIIAFVLTSLTCFLFVLLGIDFFSGFVDGWIPGLGSFLENYVGALTHLVSFNRGVIDIKDILYFVAMSAVFLLLNGFSFEGRLRPKAKFIFGSSIAVCLAGVILFNWLAHDLALGRFDITENKIYTVCAASRKILANLKGPVQIKVYITPSDKMPTAFKSMEQDITAKLDELRIASKNKLRFKVFYIEAANLIEANKRQNSQVQGVEPAVNSLEKTLQGKGIVPFQVESIDRDAVGLRLIYSAITVSYMDKNEEVLPRVFPQNIPDLEYVLISRIVKLSLEARPRIALFSPSRTTEMHPGADSYQALGTLIKNNGYDFERIALTQSSPIPEGTNTLLVINPGNLGDRQLYEINKFLYQGGSVLIAAQGFDYLFQMAAPQGMDVSPNKLSLDVNRLIQKWGIGINDKMLMGEDNQIINLSVQQGIGPFGLTVPIKLPNQIVVRQQFFNDKASLMNRLSAIFYLWGSALDISDTVINQSQLKKTLLFTSSPKSWQVPFESGIIKSESFVFPQTGSPGKFPLGVMLQGQFSNTFAGANVPGWPDLAGENKAEAKLEPKPGKLILIGCAKMFSDQLITGSGNLSLFANIVDSSTLGDDLIQIRSKAFLNRDLKKLTDAQKIWYRFLAVAGIPLIWAIFAYARIMFRKKEKAFYLAARGQ
ncbi:MAG: Gldg family protein [Candidatus Omnitrophota bacterium]|nr:Gldg family protein [Candidatus Omnitrophota bacterium]